MSLGPRNLLVLLLIGRQIKHRKPAPSQDKGGLLASIGSSLTGPRFHETDEVGPVSFL